MAASNSRSGAGRRLAALSVGAALLLLAELVLRLAGFGGPGHRPDPFAGFSATEPLFVPVTLADGREVLRTRQDRIGPFNAQEFPRVKAPGTVRLFCLGGSSSFGFPYDNRISFCAATAQGLRLIHPEMHYELINCGGMSYGSRRVLNVMRELTAYDPDGFIAYMGHNEYVERRFYAPFLSEPFWRRQLRAGLNRIRIYVAMRRLLDPLLPDPSTQSGDTDPFGTGPLRDDSRRQTRDPREDALVQEQFRFSVAEMSALARAGDVPLFLVLPASNLRDWRPEGSAWDDRLSAPARDQRDTAVAAARRLQRAGDLVGALEKVDEALALDPLPAAVHFLRGQLLMELGRPGDLEALREARDRDTVPIRITGPLLEILRAAARSGAAPALNAGEVLASVSPRGIVGSEMVLDYCHPSPKGHRHIASLLLPAIAAALWPREPPPQVAPEDLLPPGGEGTDALSSAFGAAWAGQMLVRQGRLEGAAGLFRRALALDPDLATAHEGLGRVLSAQGKIPEAISALEEATRLAPGLANGWNNLGQVYRAAGRLEDALAAYRRALGTGVGTGVIRRNIAATLLKMGRLQEALQEATQATRASPGDALGWVMLGEIEAALGHAELASKAHEKARSLDPSIPAARRGPATPGTPSQDHPTR
ncbi:MAG: tetratricopeptide repeat protein [Acidobacteria bacterium]|nr:tetratricopeptide repeat protein [Acidobacteriota bacterium]